MFLPVSAAPCYAMDADDPALILPRKPQSRSIFHRSINFLIPLFIQSGNFQVRLFSMLPKSRYWDYGSVLTIIIETGIFCCAWLLIPYHGISKGVDAGRRLLSGYKKAACDLR